METTNHFRFIGLCYGNAKITETKNGTTIANFVLVVKNSDKEKSYIPLVAVNHEALLAANICRNGNIVSVSGKVRTKEKNDFNTGEVWISVSFLVEDICLNTKAVKVKLNDKKVQVVNKWFCPDPLEETNNDK